MLLKFLGQARRDLNSIEIYLEEVSSRDVAASVTESLQTRCERIAALSGTLGTDRSELRPGIRSTPHGNYIILFRYADDAVEIVNILHASRDLTTHYDEG